VLRFQILGSVSVFDDEGAPLALTDHQRALLADLLIHANEIVSIDRLLNDLWGERPPANARASLRNLVWKLRGALGPATLETRAPGYMVILEPEQLDAAQFERLIARARNENVFMRIRSLEEALALWQGEDPLADVLYEPFAQPMVMRLDELRANALEDLLDAKLSLAELAPAAAERAKQLVPDLRAFVARYPHRERLHAQLAQALHVAGRTSDALLVKERWRTRLMEEWGIEPDFGPVWTKASGTSEPGRLAHGLEAFPIEELELSARTYNGLKSAGIDSVEDLVGKTEQELAAIALLSDDSVKLVMERLALHGLSLSAKSRPLSPIDLSQRALSVLSALLATGVDFIVASSDVVAERLQVRLICPMHTGELEAVRYALVRLNASYRDDDGRVKLLAEATRAEQAAATRRLDAEVVVGTTVLMLDWLSPKRYDALLFRATETVSDGVELNVLGPGQTWPPPADAVSSSARADRRWREHLRWKKPGGR